MEMGRSLEKRVCVVCSKARTQVCNGCKGALDASQDPIEGVPYCSLDCQKAHWPIHISECNDARDRRDLYRAAHSAQNLFYDITERLYRTSVEHVEREEDGNLLVYEGLWRDTHFGVFPTEKCKSVADKEAVLAMLNCRTLLVHLHYFLTAVLRDIASGIVELSISLKDWKHRIQFSFRDGSMDDNSEYRHAIIKVTLRNGEEYALDISSAQYGYYQSVVPWQKYHDTRIAAVETVRPFGRHRATSRFLEKPKNGNGGIKAVNEEIAEVVNKEIEEWQRRNVKVNRMIRLPEAMYKQKRDELLRRISRAIEDHRDALDEAGERQADHEDMIRVARYNGQSSGFVHKRSTSLDL